MEREDKDFRDWDKYHENPDFSGRDLAFAMFQGAEITRPDFRYANLQCAKFDGAWLTYPDFRYADLRGTSFRGTRFFCPDFRGTSLLGADTTGATIKFPYLQGITGYVFSREIFLVLVGERNVRVTLADYQMLGEVVAHGLCWDKIARRFKKKPLKLFERLAQIGYSEYLEFYSELLKEKGIS